MKQKVKKRDKPKKALCNIGDCKKIGTLQINPYLAEIFNEQKLEYICDECYRQLMEEI